MILYTYIYIFLFQVFKIKLRYVLYMNDMKIIKLSKYISIIYKLNYVVSPAEIVGSNPTRGMDVCCECCVLLGRGLCDELITRPGEFYRLWCVVVCDLETSRMRRP
jgi:hypothetical protein